MFRGDAWPWPGPFNPAKKCCQPQKLIRQRIAQAIGDLAQFGAARVANVRRDALDISGLTPADEPALVLRLPATGQSL
jgi:hypothetical protein